jgi:hypothetical protein
MTTREFRLDWSRDWPALVVFGSCLFLQRFGLPLGSMPVPLVLPIVAGVFALLLIQNRLRVSRLGLGAWLLMASWFICVSALAMAMPSPSSEPSLSSLWYFLVAYSFLVFRWEPAIGVRRTLWIFRGFVTAIALCGLAQFAAQFAGVRLFQFRGLVPEAFLVESGYNLVIALKLGSGLYKSNGMFLLEPSIFSQFSAVALVIEFLYFGSRLRMALFTLALVVAFSCFPCSPAATTWAWSPTARPRSGRAGVAVSCASSRPTRRSWISPPIRAGWSGSGPARASTSPRSGTGTRSMPSPRC